VGLKNNFLGGGRVEEDYGVGWFTGVPFCLSFVLRIDLWASDFELVLRCGKRVPIPCFVVVVVF